MPGARAFRKLRGWYELRLNSENAGVTQVQEFRQSVAGGANIIIIIIIIINIINIQ